VNRENRFVSQGGGVLSRSLEGGDLRGKEIRLRASVRAEVEGAGNQGVLWLRVDREGEDWGCFDNMADRPIVENAWQSYEIAGDVADDAVGVAFGAVFQGEGRLWLDDFQVESREGGGEWQPVELENAGFEAGDVGGEAPGWRSTGPGTSFQVSDGDSQGGERSLVITRDAEVFTGTLFEAVPSMGDVIKEDLGGGVEARVPVALFSDDSGTVASGLAAGARSAESPGDLRAALAGIDLPSLTADSETVRLADVVIAWNVFQHFYPYFEEAAVDWEPLLPEFLDRALFDADAQSFFRTLKRLVARLRDGHGRVIHATYQPSAALPLLLDWVEGRVVVTVSQDSRLLPGDVVLSIDGVDAEEALEGAEEMISGSPQWMRVRALREVTLGQPGSTAGLMLERDGEAFEVELERGPLQAISEARPENIEELEDGIFYVNLDQASAEDIGASIDELAAARGVVFDMRGYPNGNHMVIGHLLQIPDTSTAWMRVQQIIYPDQERIAGHQNHGWSLQPLDPHIGGKAVFLTDGRAISYAESFMGFIEHYRLAEIVGGATAGANGNVNPFALPGGFRITWTGMKVVKHDGSQHHLVGVQPTVPLERTIQGVREGRDELLEKALEIIRE
jgi:hypothetical protein